MFAELLIPLVIMGSLALALGLVLGYMSKIFHVPENEKVSVVRDILSGANCGACGFPGCDGFAKAVVEGGAPASACTVGGASIAGKIAEVMGVEAETTNEKRVAFVRCAGDLNRAGCSYQYTGINSCGAMALMVNGGPKACVYGCLGGGACAAACPFGAIQMVDGIAVVDTDACTACAVCVSACPKKLIEIVPDGGTVRIACNSLDTGRVVRNICSAGCIACKICAKVCPHSAITIADNLPRWMSENCDLCGDCAEKCPTKVISIVRESSHLTKTNEE